MNKVQKLLLAQQKETVLSPAMEAEYSFSRRIGEWDMELLKLNMNPDTMEGMGKLSSIPSCRTKNTYHHCHCHDKTRFVSKPVGLSRNSYT